MRGWGGRWRGWRRRYGRGRRWRGGRGDMRIMRGRCGWGRWMGRVLGGDFGAGGGWARGFVGYVGSQKSEVRSQEEEGSGHNLGRRLGDVLAEYLGRQTGVEISGKDFEEGGLEPWLRMNFRVVDDEG